MTDTTTTCAFKGCGRDVSSNGLCHGHAMQKYRGATRLKPLRERSDEPGVRVPGLTIPKSVAKLMRQVDPSLYMAAKKIITEWADKAGKR